MEIDKKIIKKISSIVGKDFVKVDLEDRICYSYDATNLSYLPDAVVFPRTTQEIAEIIKLANKERFYVTPRGAGTGMSGGSLPVKGGIVLAMSRFNRILKIDTENLIAVVEPGVITGVFQKEVERLGLFYPPDPASLNFCTLGGNLAECAGGARAIKYGVTKDYVLGLEAVLATGDILHTGVETMKGVVGYDLTKLLVGSEGTLGIITKIVLKLLPLPEAKQTLLAIFDKLQDATHTVTNIIQSKIIPTTLEYMDKTAIFCVENYLNIGLPTDVEALLLIEVDGEKESVQTKGEKIRIMCLESGARAVEIAKSVEESERLWQARRSVSPAAFKLKPNKVSEDIVVPRTKLPQMIDKIKGIGETYGLTVLTFGHAGDGNIHVNFMIDQQDKDEVSRTHKAVEELFRATLDLGGTLSGEHGIGITKARYLSMEIGSIGIDTMKKIKQVFDPNNILNPGKIFVDDQ